MFLNEPQQVVLVQEQTGEISCSLPEQTAEFSGNLRLFHSRLSKYLVVDWFRVRLQTKCPCLEGGGGWHCSVPAHYLLTVLLCRLSEAAAEVVRQGREPTVAPLPQPEPKASAPDKQTMISLLMRKLLRSGKVKVRIRRHRLSNNYSVYVNVYTEMCFCFVAQENIK